ncbi:WD40 repeat domain-containing protein [Limnofasciculus baicalensis]|uniref:WD40 repeat domain-containing protein n=1 Tax=Limnofasciculus baicalensis BBK-W-15 TaxID=2699891 RepID=A0AAE3KQ95_9CYAN|nr:WD40 repeat domain-containing protein [Limnofasciculus baicalensis]MCP2727082.1 WD40 repeat domain-containing protein [Limnofasciculus baicalensis BBK-W-15]
MKLLPYDSFTIQTRDPLPLILQRLNTKVEAPRIRFGFSHHHALYQGTVSEGEFKITRIINYRNSFLPIIRGSFEQQPDGTTIIHITMGLHPFVMAFLWFWYLTWYSGSIPIVFIGGMPSIIAVPLIGLPILILAAFWYGFWFEADRSRREVTEIILGEIGLENNEGDRKNSTWLRKIAQGIGIVLFVAITFTILRISFLPFLSVETKEITHPCQSEQTHSPYCDFSLIRTITNHPSASVIAISADSRTLVSGGDDKAIKVWDIATGKLQKTLQSDSGKVLSLAISHDGKTVVSGSGDRMVRVWNITTGKRQAIFKGHDNDVTSIAISEDGKTIASGSWGLIEVWDLATGKLKFTLPDDTLKKKVTIGFITIDNEPSRTGIVEISEDGKTAIIVNYNNMVEVWDLTTGKLQNSFKEGFGSNLSANLSSDGKVAVIQYQTYNHGGKTKVWDLTTGKEKASRSVTASSINAIPMTLNKDKMIGSSNKAIQVWNLNTAKLEASIDTGLLSNIAISLDSKTLVGITGDPSLMDAQIKVWQRKGDK